MRGRSEQVFFFCRFPSYRPFKDPGLARPACNAASARLLLFVAVLACLHMQSMSDAAHAVAGLSLKPRKASVVGASVAEEKTHVLDNTHRSARAHLLRTGRILRADLNGAFSSEAWVPGTVQRGDIAHKHPPGTGETARGRAVTPPAPWSGVLIPQVCRRRSACGGSDSSREECAGS